jgi:hypothetical protein
MALVSRNIRDVAMQQSVMLGYGLVTLTTRFPNEPAADWQEDVPRMNLVSLVQSQLTPAVVTRMATSLGLPQGPASRGISAAVPAVLASLASSTAGSGGAQRLAKLVGKQDPALIRNYPAYIGSSAQAGVVDAGSGALGSLLGAPAAAALSGAVGKYTGLALNQASALTGALTPLILSQLARTQKSERLDASGLSSLLLGQRDAFLAAMPNGFARLAVSAGVPLPQSTAPAPQASSHAGQSHAGQMTETGAGSVSASSAVQTSGSSTAGAPGHVMARAALATVVALLIGLAIVVRYMVEHS